MKPINVTLVSTTPLNYHGRELQDVTKYSQPHESGLGIFI